MWQYMNNPGVSRGLTSALSELLKREWIYTPGWRQGLFKFGSFRA